MAHHLTPEDREHLAILKDRGQSQAEIARALKRSPSTISRELRRNGSGRRYWAVRAQRRAESRRRQSQAGTAMMNGAATSDYERKKLVCFWSPEQIAGRLRREFPTKAERRISHQTIYAWIHRDPYRRHWETFLRHRGRKRSRPEKRGCLAGCVPVAHRPKAANARRRYGDWEGDTVVSPGRRSGVLTLVERKSRYTVVGKVRNLQARTVRGAARAVLGELPARPRRTATFDNGKKFAEHHQLAAQLGLAIYLAQLYAAWQRGTNENTNGLLRQFHPKGTDWA
jgi:IS30 family transposase